MPFEFGKQYEIGKLGAERLDKYFAQKFFIVPTPLAVDELGIDRFYYDRSDARRCYTIEYKTDQQAQTYHNAFVETVAFEGTKRYGWAITCQADFLFYYVWGEERVIIVRPRDVRARLSVWARRYPIGISVNYGYRFEGLKVPLDEFVKVAPVVIEL